MHPPIYLYLSETSFCETWENGGTIPVNNASRYLRLERSGIYTPDEVGHRTVPDAPGGFFGQSDEAVLQLSNTPIGTRHMDITFINCVVDDGHDRKTVSGHLREWLHDVHVLSFSTERSLSLLRRLDKQACVEIVHFDLFKAVLDSQMGREGTAGLVNYTGGLVRNHFVKSAADEWQREFRLIWDTGKKGPIEVEIPSGLAKRVHFDAK